MKAKILGKKYEVFVNGIKKPIVTGRYISMWAAHLAAANAWGMDRKAGTMKIRPVK